MRRNTKSYTLVLLLLRREIRSGFKGFGIFFISLFFGVTAIAGIGSIGAALKAGLIANGQTVLGGDIDLRLLHRAASGEQRQWLQQNTKALSEIVKMRAMARPADNKNKRSLVELKAVDAAYPLAGTYKTDQHNALADLLAYRNGAWGAVVDANLLSRLKIKIGSRIAVGDATYELRARVIKEPDRITNLFSLGPRLLVARSSLHDTGLIQLGSHIHYHVRALLPGKKEPSAWKEDLIETFPKAGWRVRSANDAAPGVRSFLERMRLFLSFVGLAVLLIGGIGVAGSVTSFLTSKTATIAMLKCLGAPGHLIFQLYLSQVAVLAALSVLLGTAVGAALPAVLDILIGDILPVRPVLGIYPLSLLIAVTYGLLVAITFAIWPVARAREVTAAALFRDLLQPVDTIPRPVYLCLTAIGIVLLGALTILLSENRAFSSWFVAGTLVVFVFLFYGSKFVMRVARGISSYKGKGYALLGIALANLYRPGAMTTSVTLSLGLGLSVLSAVTLIEGNLTRQIEAGLPEQAPAIFFIDIQPHQVAAFDKAVNRVSGTSGYQRVPTLRGRIVRIAGKPVVEAKIARSSQWAIRGDRALTYSSQPRIGSKITAGNWWPPDYQGPPAISLDAGLARGFGVDIGDTLTINILGREVTAEIKSLREINWGSLRFDFAIIFAPGALDSAPHTYIAAINVPPGMENTIESAATDPFPNITAIRVRDAVEAAADILSGIRWVISGIAGLTILAGAIVLAGALTAGRQRRIKESVIYKVLGATRGSLTLIYALEYGFLGLLTGILAAGIGTLTAWAVVTMLLQMDWVFLPITLTMTIGMCIAVTLLIGFLSTWRVLGRTVAPYLRND
tara:strand:+ start:5466 stop:8015 length:2550 start_codon:yes stop_codon:yes gene_type:complete